MFGRVKEEQIKISLDTKDFQKKIDSLNTKIYDTKQFIKDAEKALKNFQGTAKQRQNLILEVAGAKKEIKEMNAQIKDYQKGVEKVNKRSTRTFKRMALLLTAAAGAGAGLAELFRTLFKESAVFQQLRAGIESFGKSISSVIDKAFKPFLKNMRDIEDIKLDKELEKVEEKANKNIASFEALATKVRVLGNVLNPTVIQQREYAKAVEQIKGQYPELLKHMSTEIQNHKDNSKLIEAQRKLLYRQIAEKMLVAKNEELIKRQIKERLTIQQEENKIEAVAFRQKVEYDPRIAKKVKESKEIIEEAKKREQKVQEELNKVEKEYLQVIKDITVVKEEAEPVEEKIIENTKAQAKATDDLIKKWKEWQDARTTGGSGEFPEVPEWMVKEKEGLEDLKATWDEYASYVIDIGNSLAQIQLNNIQSQYDEEKDKLTQKYNDQLISKEEYERELSKLDKKRAKEEKAAKLQQKAWAITEIGVNTWVEASKAWSQPWLAAAIIAAGVAAAAQVATAEFAKGGLLPEHAYGGLSSNPNENIALIDRSTGNPVGTMSSLEPIMGMGVATNPQAMSEASDLNVKYGGRAFAPPASNTVTNNNTTTKEKVIVGGQIRMSRDEFVVDIIDSINDKILAGEQVFYGN